MKVVDLATGRPVFLFDGDCGFCTSCARFIERHIPTSAQVVPWQRIELAELGFTPAECAAAVQWLSDDRTVRAAAVPAIALLLIDAGSFWGVLGRLLHLAPVAWVAGGVYRVVARYRHRLPGGTPACGVGHRV